MMARGALTLHLALGLILSSRALEPLPEVLRLPAEDGERFGKELRETKLSRTSPRWRALAASASSTTS